MTTIDFYCGGANTLYSSIDYKRVENYFEVQTTLMSLIGQNPKRLNQILPRVFKNVGLLIARLYSGFVLINAFFFTVLLTKTTYDSVVVGDLESMSDALTNLLIYSISFCSTLYTLWNIKWLTSFMNRINRDYRHHSLAGFTFVSQYVPYRKVKIFSVIWTMTCFSGVCTWGITPILLRTRSLPFKCWYPYDVMAPIVFEINYFVQFFGQINVGFTYSTCSGLFLTFVILFLSQMDVLYCSIKNLTAHAKLLRGEDLKMLRQIQAELPLGKHDEVNQYLLLKEYKTDLDVFKPFYARGKPTLHLKSTKIALHESLKECIQLHRFILKSCQELENFYHPLNLVITLQCSVQLCLLVFAAISTQNSTMRTFNQIQYFFLTFINLVIYTYCGELLYQHSLRAGQAFWRSHWTLTDMHMIRRDIMIFLLNTHHVVKLTAGKFYTMDVNHLRKVITQVFSLFTLLRKIAEKKGL